MRKSILVTAAIAVTAGALALAFAQTEQGKTFFGTQTEQTTQELIASAMTTETNDAETVDAETAAVEETTDQDTVAEATPTETTTQPTMASETAGMTPVDLDNVPTTDTAAVATTDTQATLNEQSPAAGEETAAEAETSPVGSATAETPKETIKIDIAAALKDREIGSKDAPVTVYDFSSLTCPHCAHFHNDVLPKIKKEYIDTGKVRWVFHGFPLNEPALKGEMISRCAPNDQYQKLQDLMYKNQERWAFDENPMANLNMFLRLAGITDDMFLSCVNNTELQEALMKKYQAEGEKFEISSTPTFIFNDGAKKFSGAGTFEGFAYDLDALLKQAASKKTTPVKE